MPPKRNWMFFAYLSLSLGRTLGGDLATALSSKDSPVEMPGSQHRWSFGVGFAPIFNVSSSFSGIGGITAANAIPPDGTAVFGEYDDGFVRPDIAGNPALTSNWGYQRDDQYDPANGGSIGLSISDVPGSARANEEDEAGAGFELFANFEAGKLDLGGRTVTWGLQGRFNYANLDIGNSSTRTLDGRRTTDRFPLEGVIPPLAPYNGSFSGPFPVISTDAVRSEDLLAGAAGVTGSREIDADLASLNFGPWIAVPLSEKFVFQAEAGLTLALVDGTYRHRSTTSFGSATPSDSGSADKTSVLPGFYVGAGIQYALSNQWDIYLNARYQYLDDFQIRAGSSKAEIAFDEAFIISAGVRFKF